MNKNSLKQMIVAEMILADVEGGDSVPPKKRSLFEMMGDSYLDELEDGRLAHSMESVEDLFETKPTKPKKTPTKKKDAKSGDVPVVEPTVDDPSTNEEGETEEQRKARIAKNLKDFGLTPDDIANDQVLEPELSAEEEEELKSKVGEGSIDLALNIAGFIGGYAGMLFAAPTGGISLVVGAIPDIINGIRKVNRGEYFDGVLDFICAIPAVGEAAAIIKGLNEAEKIVKLIALAKKLKGIVKKVKAVIFIKKMISKFVNDDRKEGAQAAFDDIVSGDPDRIKRTISATDPVTDPVTDPIPDPVTDPVTDPVSMLGGLEYLDSLAQAELAGGNNVAESKNASRLSLVSMLYSD